MKPVILLVDDERDLIEVLSDAIGMALPDYEAVITTSLDDAEVVLSKLHTAPSLVCVDHKLGERTGLEFLESLAQRSPSMPKILFTGQAPPDVESRAQAIGARVLWKPFGLSTWIGEVREMLMRPTAAA